MRAVHKDRFGRELKTGDHVMVDDFTLGKVADWDPKVYGDDKVMVTMLSNQQQAFWPGFCLLRVEVGPDQKITLDAWQHAANYDRELID